jgi:hypothetical protein
MAKDRKVYRVINPLFLERKQGFISKEAGNRDLGGDLAFQKVFNKVYLGSLGSSGTRGGITEALGARDASSTSTTGAGGATSSGKNKAEVKAKDIGKDGQRLPRIEVVIPQYKPLEAPQSNLPIQPSPTRTTPPLPPREVSSRQIRRPTQAAIEARETEAIYGQKPRTQRCRKEREVVKDSSSCY